MKEKRIWYLAKGLALPGLVYIFMQAQVMDMQRANDITQMQWMMNDKAQQTDFVFREINNKLDEAYRMIDGMHHEIDMIRRDMDERLEHGE